MFDALGCCEPPKRKAAQRTAKIRLSILRRCRYQERVWIRPRPARFTNQDVESDGSEIVDEWVGGGILLQIDDFRISPALVAGLGFDRLRLLRHMLIGDALGGGAVGAFDAHIIPLAGAQRAAQEAHALQGPLGEDRSEE